MKLLIVVTILAFLSYGNCAKCPDGTVASVKCSTSCAGKCYSDLDEAEPGESYCCENLSQMCPTTGLITFHSGQGNSYKHKWDVSLKGQYYQDPTTKFACPLPYSLSTSLVSKDLPIGFRIDSATPIKQCKENSECGEGNYCGEVMNPSFPDSRDKSLLISGKKFGSMKFCYPKPANFVNIRLEPAILGLEICNKHSDCDSASNHFCLILGPGKEFKRDDSVKKGVCALGESSFKSLVPDHPLALLSKSADFCKQDDECQLPEGLSADAYQARCTSINSHYSDIKLCNIAPKQCTYGYVSLPLQKCDEKNQCSKDGKSWCDPTGTCCSHSDPLFHMCPDRITPLFNEPMCANVDPSDEYSGECTYDANAMCFRGHCCSRRKIENDEVKLAPTLYKTSIICDVLTITALVMAYCYQGYVIIAGSDSIEETEQLCSTNDDCSTDQSRVCVSTGRNGTKKACIRNKLKEPQDNSSSSSFRLFLSEHYLYGIGILAFIVLLIIIVVFCCYRRYKKAKGMNKPKPNKHLKDSPKPYKTTPLKADNMTADLSAARALEGKIDEKLLEKNEDSTRTAHLFAPIANLFAKPEEEIKVKVEEPITYNEITCRDNTVKEIKEKSVKVNVVLSKEEEELKDKEWYIGLCPIELIKFVNIGDYVVHRVETDDGHYFELVVKGNSGLEHYIIKKKNKKRALEFDENNTFINIEELITFYKNSSGSFRLGDPMKLPNTCKIDIKLHLEKVLGSGSYGSVVLVKDADGAIVAVKISHAGDKYKPNVLADMMLKEAIMLMKLSGIKNVVSLAYVLCGSNTVRIAMEYCVGGSLESHLKQFGKNIGRFERGCYLVDILRGMKAITARNIVHRDVAARNIFICHEGRLKLGDTGLSVERIGGAKTVQVEHGHNGIPLHSLPPEAFQKIGEYGEASDMWAFALTVFEIEQQGDSPTRDLDLKILKDMVRNVRMPVLPTASRAELKELCGQIFQLEPDSRPTFEAAERMVHKMLENMKNENSRENGTQEPLNFAISKLDNVRRTFDYEPIAPPPAAPTNFMVRVENEETTAKPESVQKTVETEERTAQAHLGNRNVEEKTARSLTARKTKNTEEKTANPLMEHKTQDIEEKTAKPLMGQKTKDKQGKTVASEKKLVKERTANKTKKLEILN